MKHIYHKIPGWFSFPNLYKSMVERFEDGSIFVEVGTHLGKSISYLAVEIINSNKNISLYCVDKWEHLENKLTEQPELLSKNSNCNRYERFLKNIKPIENFIKPIKSSSTEAANNFADNSLDFVFIDARHDYDSVKADLDAWYPKLKPAGVFAGHDYDYPRWRGVVKAVDDFCVNKKLTLMSPQREHCWVIDLKQS
jgi:predicted O-methyltransferase YrrM